MNTLTALRAYIAALLVALTMVCAYSAITEGFIFERAWGADCAALERGEAISAEDISLEDIAARCR